MVRRAAPSSNTSARTTRYAFHSLSCESLICWSLTWYHHFYLLFFTNMALVCVTFVGLGGVLHHRQTLWRSPPGLLFSSYLFVTDMLISHLLLTCLSYLLLTISKFPVACRTIVKHFGALHPVCCFHLAYVSPTCWLLLFSPVEAARTAPGLLFPSLVFVTGKGTPRAKDAQRTPTQSHISPSVLRYEDWFLKFSPVEAALQKCAAIPRRARI